jgi:hypothetical protein
MTVGEDPIGAASGALDGDRAPFGPRARRRSVPELGGERMLLGGYDVVEVG